MGELFSQAEAFARKAHKGQFRRDGKTPYITHPTRVAEILYSWGISDDLFLSIAILHDVIEDTKITIEDIKKEFVSPVLSLYLDILTHKEGQSYEDYINSIANSPPTTVRIKIADILANLDDRPSQKQTKKYASALLVLTKVLMMDMRS